MDLTGPQFETLNEALRQGFTINRLERMVRFQFGKDLEDYAGLNNDRPRVVFDLTTQVQREGWLPQLVEGARRANPGNPALAGLASVLGMAPISITDEKVIEERLPFLDINRLRTWLTEVEFQVCRIAVPGTGGTGFLLGPDVLITNHHVLESVIDGPNKAEDVVLYFDYKILAGDTSPTKGATFRLKSTNWLLDSSPRKRSQQPVPDGGASGSETALDYALVRVEGSPGTQEVNLSANPASNDLVPRGWVKIPDPMPALATDDPVFIVQHPARDPLKFAMNTQSFLGIFDDGARFRHRTGTKGGSSGSPCFDVNLSLVALHCGTGPGDEKWNEAVPISAIAAELKKCDTLKFVNPSSGSTTAPPSDE